MITGTFSIRIREDRMQEVTGVLFPEYGLAYDRRDHEGQFLGYCITHLGTGLMLLTPYPKEEQAKQAILSIGPLYDWSSLQGFQRVRHLSPQLADVFEKMNQIDGKIRERANTSGVA
jgi:hypothetical protein